MGCGASSKGDKYHATAATGADAQTWASPPTETRSSQGTGTAFPASPSSRSSADNGAGSYRRNKNISATVPLVAPPTSTVGPPPPVNDSEPTSPGWEVQEIDKDETPGRTEGPTIQQTTLVEGSAEAPSWDTCSWWGECAEWIYQRSGDILAAYNFFFEHIGLRKGWRVAPFTREDVQEHFRAAAEVVVVVRARLDHERGAAIVLRQVEGSAMNFLWGWNPNRSPGSTGEATQDFLRGLVFATLSDGRGLVEGLDQETVDGCVCSHPFSVKATADTAAVEAAGACPVVASLLGGANVAVELTAA